MSPPVLSVVIPAYNEAAALPAITAQLVTLGTALNVAYELIVVNDGSTDHTDAVITQLTHIHPQIVAVHLSRNFGKEAAMMAGLTVTRGQCVAMMDADLQHPPQLLIEMFALWQAGYAVVNAVKRRPNTENVLYRASARLFNQLMSDFIGADMSNASDFKLLDREVVDVLLTLPERNRFFSRFDRVGWF